MSTFLKKKLHLCFSSSGVVSPSIPSSPIVVPNPNPPSHHHHHHHTPSIFINTFNSLYDHLSVSSPLHRNDKFTSVSVAAALTTPKSGETGSSLFTGGLRRTDDDEEDEEEDEDDEDENYGVVSKLLNDGTAITKRIDSPDPRRDFGRSMREMVEARDLNDASSNREYLNELLFCYLSLNPKHTHKFIVSAFADTLLCLLSQSSSSPAYSLSHSI